eukprot:s863_g39.t1
MCCFVFRQAWCYKGNSVNAYAAEDHEDVGDDDWEWQQHDWEESDRKWEHEIQSWEERAYGGQAASARAPKPVTPSPRARFVPLDAPSPPQKVVHPTRKSQLAASKRLAKELSKGTAKKTPQPAGSSQKKPKVPKSAKGKESEKAEVAGKKRKPSAGPMMVAMGEFVKEAKAAGSTYKESLLAWKNSKEREAIVKSLPDHEVKRRRY